MATMFMTRPGGYTPPEPKRCIRCGRRLGAQGLIRFCLNQEACRARADRKAAAKPTVKGFTHDWQGTPYENAACPGCGGILKGPASRMPHLMHQHRLRCDRATHQERMTWKQTGRWPAKGA